MEHMNVFHRIFHEDLHPFTNQRSREYYLDQCSKNSYYTNYLELDNLSNQELKFCYYQKVLNHALKEIKRGLHKKLFSLVEESENPVSS